ncbi:hypothetical protein BEH_24195 [Priestia filamentosa]|uniref:glutaminase n=1 Tax=Priestia filamentosa TaxID=1402861 RepID=A0A2S1LZA7_9BACI|nr:glutaminase [Priestia filamentosa]AWG44152.1 hypothetical protein BEH_24195 [Priestia filamentosa]
MQCESSQDLKNLVDEARIYTKEGQVAQYIPALREADPDKLAVAVYYPNGNCYAAGDVKHKMTLQSISKVISLALALMDRGEDFVFDYVGKEPTGERVDTKIIKRTALQLAIPSIMKANLYKWLDNIASQASQNVSKWIKQISNRITASQLSRDSGGRIAVSTFARLLKGRSLFSKETFSTLEDSYNAKFEDFIEFANLPPISRETLLSKTIQRRGKKFIDSKIDQSEIPFTKEWIVAQIKQTKKELGRTPYYIEMAEKGIKHHHFRKHFGGYKQALGELGLKPTPHQGMRFEVKETKRELIKMYTEFSRKIGRTARRTDLNNSDEIYNYEYFMKVFNNLDELKRAAAKRGVPNPHSRNYTEDEIMDKLVQLYKKKGSRLIRDEVAPHLNVVTVKNYLGVSKWKEVMDKVEEEIERRNNIEE